VVRLIHAGMFLAPSSHDDQIRVTDLELVAAPALVVAAAFVESPYRELLWIAAASLDFGGPLLAGVAGFRIVPTYS
jgi:hypothetical protein